MADSAVVLLSGGMDSAVTAAWAKERGYSLLALSVDYGQRHRVELEAAGRLARVLGAKEHATIRVDLRAIGGSALTGDFSVPLDRKDEAGEIPPTYVPARNLLLLSLGLGLAESRGARAVAIGVNRVDYSGYPDCRPAFLDAFRRVAAVGTKVGVEGRAPEILAPLLELSKAQIVLLGARLGVPFEETVSCYAPGEDGAACGRCDACRLRLRGFSEAKIPDPARYARPSGPSRS